MGPLVCLTTTTLLKSLLSHNKNSFASLFEGNPRHSNVLSSTTSNLRVIDPSHLKTL
ncbi:hypothetical protein KFK09_026267 [Dendrobium nobile]|uniref:Uncharacterized protein n=1 Tax=Dendrobium nobile TaxID=94219 RepID=A0A8T3A7D0_DENNO|nr:hypothetical protein KFK09_026267 [Dendrobium nobile]